MGNEEVREAMGQRKGQVGILWEKVRGWQEGRMGKSKGMVRREGWERVRRW